MVKTGKELERRVAQAYREIGARKVEHNVELVGHQIDIYVELETPDRSLHRIAVEAKDHASPVGIDIVTNFSTTVDHLRRERLIDEGVIVAATGFSRQARNAVKNSDIRLLELADLDAMVAEARAMRHSALLASVSSFGSDNVSSLRSSLGATSTRLLNFEFDGITSEQKAIMSRELDRLWNDAVGERDAIAVRKIQEMRDRLDVLVPKGSFFEDDFSNLEKNWEYKGEWLVKGDGENKILRVTNSGVGGIAKPCLSWADYVFEFDTKIENTCSAWIIRAKDLGEYVMLQCHLDRIRPLFRMNGEWYDLGWTDRNAVRFPQVLVLNTWYHVQITVEGTRVTTTIVGDLVGRRMDITGLPSLKHPHTAASYLAGSVGFRESSTECAYFRNVKVEKLR